MSDPVLVHMGEYKITRSPGTLMCIGLGSCVGIVLYSPVRKVGGLAHIMLPRQDGARPRANPAKFADASIQLMLDELVRYGSSPEDLQAKIFGGAYMFPNVDNILMNIGERNVLAAHEELHNRRIALIAKDVGGHCSRTILFDTTDGSVRLRFANGDERLY